MNYLIGVDIRGTFTDFAPDNLQSDCGMMDRMTIQGAAPNGRWISTINFSSYGFGTLADLDGGDTVPALSNAGTTLSTAKGP